MARLGNNGEVSISVDTSYNGKGMEQAKKDMEAMSLKMKAELEKGTSHLDRMRQSIEGIKGAWAELLAAYGAVRFLSGAAQEALQAEIAFRKMRTQVEMTGVSWQAVSREVDAAIASSARYARVQEEEVMDSMRQLVWATGDYRKALENLNLVQDLAYQTNISTSEATRLVSMALTGNLEMLGRVKPEFRNLDEILGKHRTTADEVAYFYAVMKEKVKGATQAMIEHEKMARDMNNTYLDLYETLGWVVNKMNVWAYKIITMKPLMDNLTDATLAFLNVYNAIRYGEDVARSMAGELEHPISQYEELGKKAGKTAKQIAAESRLRSEQAEQLRKIAELNRSLASATEDLNEQINKLTMDEQAYYEWKKQDLLQKGMELQLVNEHVEALRRLAAAEAEARKEKELTRLMEQMEKQAGAGKGGGPSGSFDVPDKPTPLSAEEEAYKRKLELAAEYYRSLDVYRSREIEQIIAIAELSAATTEAGKLEAVETAVNEQMKAEAMQATLQVAAQAYGLMINQLALLAATGKLSAKAFIAAMFDIAAGALIALGTEATVRAIMAYAKGVEAAASFDPRATLYFAAAAMYTKVAIGAGVAAVAMKAGAIALRGEGKEASPVYNANPYTGQPAESRQPAEKPEPSITIQIYNPMGNEDWDRLAEEQIVPAIRRASGRHISI